MSGTGFFGSSRIMSLDWVFGTPKLCIATVLGGGHICPDCRMCMLAVAHAFCFCVSAAGGLCVLVN